MENDVDQDDGLVTLVLLIEKIRLKSYRYYHRPYHGHVPHHTVSIASSSTTILDLPPAGLGTGRFELSSRSFRMTIASLAICRVLV